jgi:phage terminase small subunit
MRPPAWLGKDELAEWYSVRNRLKGVDLLDSLDTETLAIYCHTYVLYQKTARNIQSAEDLKLMQGLRDDFLKYADRLGLTPGSRARLAKKRAEKVEDEFGEAFD